jgi:hypothetical protein
MMGLIFCPVWLDEVTDSYDHRSKTFSTHRTYRSLSTTVLSHCQEWPWFNIKEDQGHVYFTPLLRSEYTSRPRSLQGTRLMLEPG